MSALIEFLTHPIIEVITLFSPIAWVWLGFQWGKGHDKRMLRRHQQRYGATFSGRAGLQCSTLLPNMVRCQRQREHKDAHYVALDGDTSISWARGSLAEDWQRP